MPFGAALSGEDLTDSICTPTVSISFEKLGNWNSTPIEPTSELPRATIRSAPNAAM